MSASTVEASSLSIITPVQSAVGTRLIGLSGQQNLTDHIACHKIKKTDANLRVVKVFLPYFDQYIQYLLVHL